MEFLKAEAMFSPCRKYRYFLMRKWGSGNRIINWLLWNPSIADSDQLDPTLTRCLKRSVEMGFDSMFVTNLFALVSTDPKGLKAVTDPVGCRNDDAILCAAALADMTVCGWGANAAAVKRSESIVEMLTKRRDLYALQLTRDGHPRHPLYVGYDQTPKLWIQKKGKINETT